MKRSRCRRVCARVRGDELERGDGARAVEGEVRVSLVSIVEANRGRAERGAGEFRLAGDVSRAAEGVARVGFAAGSRGEHVEIRAVGHRHGDVAGGHRRATERLRAGRRQELGEIPRHGEVGEARVVDVVDEDRHRGRKSGVVVVRGGAGFVPRVVPATRKRAAPRSRRCARRRIPETRCPFGTTRPRRDARVGPFSSSEDPNVDICPQFRPGLGLNAGQRQLGGTTTSPRLGTRPARARLPRPPAMFGPKSGPPKPVPPRRRGAPPRRPKPTFEDIEHAKEQRFLEDLGAWRDPPSRRTLPDRVRNRRATPRAAHRARTGLRRAIPPASRATRAPDRPARRVPLIFLKMPT